MCTESSEFCTEGANSMNQEIPEWTEMPKDVSIASLSWRDVYVMSQWHLGRNPTRQEVKDMMPVALNIISDDIAESLE